jgi:hypothetical protein
MLRRSGGHVNFRFSVGLFSDREVIDRISLGCALDIKPSGFNIKLYMPIYTLNTVPGQGDRPGCNSSHLTVYFKDSDAFYIFGQLM